MEVPNSVPNAGESNNDKPCSNMCVKRLQRELLEVDQSPLPSCNASPKGGNLFQWVATITGPPDTPYEGGTFFVELTFSPEYPFKPPKVIFRTKIYHCNINSQGMVCLDILKEQWSPAFSIKKILLSISYLLQQCNPDDPLVGSIATQFINDRRTHDKIARNWTKRYAQ
ncbi:ubiquitin-conjugating enzyme E2-24 kDa-like isoform X1 [Dysidea avara]|uniref:ubiquitin-conjugating enzyme E2-24 kDa-like isoform X1 n=1 Tax=Dysidea avara TaxID=196820 RepID=UPI00331FD2D2